MTRVIQALTFLIALLVASRATAQLQVLHSTFNPVPGSADALAYGSAPLSSIDPAVKFCLWTSQVNAIWPDPPSNAQVQTIANLQLNGGHNPYADYYKYWDTVVTVPKGTFVLLDGEGRTDAAILDMVTRFKSYAGSSANFSVYGLRYTLSYGSIDWLADNQYVWTRSYTARAAQIKSITDKMPVILIECYPFDPVDTWLKGWDMQVTNLRRLYPNKKLACITRGDKQVTQSNGTIKLVPLTYMERRAVTWWVNARFDMAIVWGYRNLQLQYAHDLVYPYGWDATIK
jgi:hypothetical protein